MAKTVVKFDVKKGSEIPAELLNKTSKERNSYNWADLEIGDHIEISDETEFARLRSAATNFSKGNEKRKPRNFSTRTVSVGDKRIMEIWRLPDPVVTAPVATAEAPVVEAPVVEAPVVEAPKQEPEIKQEPETAKKK